jgi:hypothetical protein
MALRCVRLALAALLGIAFVLGQDFRATVTGQITDQSGGGVSQAKVTIQNLQTNEAVSQTTNEESNYTIPFLIPGNYKVTVEAPGFTPLDIYNRRLEKGLSGFDVPNQFRLSFVYSLPFGRDRQFG